MTNDFEVVPLTDFPNRRKNARFLRAIWTLVKQDEQHGICFHLRRDDDPVKIDDALRYAARRSRVKIRLRYDPEERSIYIERSGMKKNEEPAA